VRYAVTAAAAMYHVTLGNYEHAQELAHTAIGDGVPPGSPAPFVAQNALGASWQALGEPERSLAISLDASRRLDRDFPGSVNAALAHTANSVAASQSGDPIARAEAEVGLRQAREIANPSALATALMGYGWTLIADDPVGALAAFDECIALSRQGASPISFGTTLCLAAGVRVRAGDLAHAVRDLREAVERSHQNSARLTFYTSTLWGIEILIGLEHPAEAAVFDGIASTRLSTEYRGGPGWGHLHTAITHARATYGAAQYDAAFQTGAAMSYDQAVEHALRVLDDAITELDGN
jgi:tetratricopeptide (TPR) repeat protein